MRFKTQLDEQCYNDAVTGLKRFNSEYIAKIEHSIDEELEANAELKKLFAEYPYKRTMYLYKICDSDFKKSVTGRYWNEVLTDNAALNHYGQCKDCIFRDKTTVKNVECGWKKCCCMIYEYPEGKPNYVYENAEPCECYEKQT